MQAGVEAMFTGNMPCGNLIANKWNHCTMLDISTSYHEHILYREMVLNDSALGNTAKAVLTGSSDFCLMVK